VQTLERDDLILEGGERLLVVLLLAHAGIDLPHGALEMVRLGQCPLDRLAVRLERRGLLHHRVAERLERADVAAHAFDRVLDAVEPAD
jgi:hypothetical protein